MLLDNQTINHVHCIGLSGIGVSGLAEVLLQRGYQVSGSDRVSSAITERLAKLGVTVYQGHDARHVGNADVVVYSSAVRADNPERQAALQQQKILLSRGELLAELFNTAHGVAVVGTHGKTTTTGLIAHVFEQLDLDPTYVIGGRLQNCDTTVRLGDGQHFVAEADESDASFLHLQPHIAVITNIEADHLETYGGELTQLVSAFRQFIQSIPKAGLAVLCVDDKITASLVAESKAPVMTYGFAAEALIRASEYHQVGLQSQFTLHTPDQPAIPVTLNLPGRHNVQNALAALAMAYHLGADLSKAAAALASFPGMARRFHQHGVLPLPTGEVLLLEDYGHHPEEVRVTWQAAKAAWPNKRVVVVFQPHRYSRTQDLFAEFVEVLAQPEQLVLLDIYPASEAPIPGITGQALVDAIAERAQHPPVFIEDTEQLPRRLSKILQPDDIVIFQGAGDIGNWVLTIQTRMRACLQ